MIPLNNGPWWEWQESQAQEELSRRNAFFMAAIRERQNRAWLRILESIKKRKGVETMNADELREILNEEAERTFEEIMNEKGHVVLKSEIAKNGIKSPHKNKCLKAVFATAFRHGFVYALGSKETEK